MCCSTRENEWYLVLTNLNSTGTVYIRGSTQPSRDEAVDGFVRRVAYLMSRRIGSAADLIR